MEQRAIDSLQGVGVGGLSQSVEQKNQTAAPLESDLSSGEKPNSRRKGTQAGQEKSKTSRLFKGDTVLWIIIITMSIASLLVVYSSTASMAYMKAGGNTSYYFNNQLKFVLLGLFVIFVTHHINYQTYAKYARVLFIGAMVMMLLTFFVGANFNDASRWLYIPGTSYTIQPSDFLKVTLILILAKGLARRQATIDRSPIIPVLPLFRSKFSVKQKQDNRRVFTETTLPLLMPVGLACGAIFFSNLSTAAITFFTCLIMLYIGRVRGREIWRLIRIVFVTVAVALAVMYIADIGRSRTWVNRLTDFVGMEQVDGVQNDNLQIEQAEIAIASGGLRGKGPGLSTQRANLPHSYSDFAYAFIIEEYGIAGAVVALALYLWLFFRTILIFRKCKRAFPSLLVLGLGVMIVLQAMFNMLVSVGLFPVTGQTLPMISLGGSSMLFTSLALGMILGVSRQMQEQTLGADDDKK